MKRANNEEIEDVMGEYLRQVYEMAIKTPEEKRKPFERLIIKRVQDAGLDK